MGGAHLESTTIRRLESRQNPHAGKRALRSLSRLYLFSVAQIANLPYRRLQIGRALAVFRRPGQGVVLQDGILRYSAARPSRNQNGPRLWSKTQPQRVGIAAMLRLVLL